MADKTRYPQIPSTVWWGVRSILHKSPSAIIDSQYLKAELGVQEAAAKAYIGELKAVGILTEDGKATQTALDWRLDEKYESAKSDIIESIYPAGIRQIAAQNPGNREKISNWFMSDGLGRGAANNKAATFLLIDSAEPRGASAPKSRLPAEDRRRPTSTQVAKAASQPSTTAMTRAEDRNVEKFPLNINLQIHISADAGKDQIEAIFSAMRRYINDDKDR